jgi:hypothetical protein
MIMLDRVNPVFLKELRQMVRSRSLVVSLLFFLGALMAMSAGMLALASSSAAKNAVPDGLPVGMICFFIVYGFLGFITTLVIPFSVLNRIAREREPGRADLQYSTPLPPRAFVDGKALCGAATGAFFVFAALPFMLLAYLLRGVGLGMIAGAAVSSVLGAAILSYVAILFGATKWSPLAKRVAFFLTLYFGAGNFASGIFALFAISAFSTAAASGTVAAPSSLGIFFSTPNAQSLVALVALVCVVCFAFAWYVRAFAISLLTPLNFNRARPVRQAETVIWLISLALVAFAVLASDDGTPLIFWAGFGAIFFGVRLLMSVSTPRGYSRRVRSEISVVPLRRIFQYPVFDGGENGVVFHLIMGLATLAVAMALRPFAQIETIPPGAHTIGQTGEALCVIAVFWFYLAFFALVCRAIWCRFLVGRVRPSRIGLVAFVLFGLANVVPSAYVAMNVARESYDASVVSGALGVFGNAAGAAYGLFEDIPQAIWRHLLFSTIAFAVAIALWLPALLRSVRDFRKRIV